MTQHQLGAGSGVAPVADPPGTESIRMRRVATASFVGSVIEYYDFAIYGFAAALVFSKVFFPAMGTGAATVASLGTFGVAFVARPVGAVIFGHFGDRIGRKKTLVTTLLMMGIATVMVGLLPTADQIGVAAPILLVALRILQGLAAGGEWAGAALVASENAPKARRGFWAMFASLGGGVSIVLAPMAFLLTGLGMSDEAFLSYGWRIPFLLSALLVAVGLWIRLRMDETPVFKTELARSGASKVPFLEAFRCQPREILLAAGAMTIVFSFLYIASAYLPNYGTTVLQLPRTFVLAMGAAAGGSFSAGIVLGAILSDRVGRRVVVISVATTGVVWALVLFPLLDTGSVFLFGLGAVVLAFIAGLASGPMSAFISELFHTRYRYTAAGLSYNLAGIVGGALTPILAAQIMDAYGGFVTGLLLAGFALFSLLCVRGLPETRDYELDDVPRSTLG